MGVLWEGSPGVFMLVTVALGGGAAWLTGRAIARIWRRLWQLVLYVALLAGAVRFIHFSLFGGTLLSAQYYLADFAVLLSLAGIGFRFTRAGQMARQYGWLYARSGPLSWKARAAGDDA